ncbi:MAG TPA: hypothetical protein VF572_07200 [Candidatus Saccharimonadales bacterium]|jgi:hypothetical protein
MTREYPKISNRGEMNVLVVPLILLLLFFAGAAAFGFWAYTSREDYRNNTDKKVAAAVQVAKQEQSVLKDKEHAEADKSPLRTYIGPEQFGSVHVSFPKTWSGYVNDSGNSSQPLDGYFHPNVVPGISNQNSSFALRAQVLAQPYSTVVGQINQAVTAKTVTAAAYAFPRVPSVVGLRIEGTILQGKKIKGTMIIVPLRDKTLQVWTESPVYAADFNTYVLPNLTFSP